MTETADLISAGFRMFLSATPAHSRAWMAAVEGLDSACALEGKTRHLAYLAVLAAMRLTDGVPFHAALARLVPHNIRMIFDVGETSGSRAVRTSHFNQKVHTRIPSCTYFGEKITHLGRLAHCLVHTGAYSYIQHRRLSVIEYRVIGHRRMRAHCLRSAPRARHDLGI